MKKNKYNKHPDSFIDPLLILGIILLAYNNVDGWGWLLFFLIFRHL